MNRNPLLIIQFWIIRHLGNPYLLAKLFLRTSLIIIFISIFIFFIYICINSFLELWHLKNLSPRLCRYTYGVYAVHISNGNIPYSFCAKHLNLLIFPYVFLYQKDFSWSQWCFVWTCKCLSTDPVIFIKIRQ